MAIFVDREFSSNFAVSPAIIRGEANVALVLNDNLDFEERQRFKLKASYNVEQKGNFGTDSVA